MQLVNETRLPNAVLRSLLAAAARKAGAKTTGVLVRFRWGGAPTIAYTRAVHWRIKGQVHANLRGAVQIAMSRSPEPLEFARQVWADAVHEFHHMAWAQQGKNFDMDGPYREREHEIAAYDCQHDAERNIPPAVQDMILALALAREGLKGRRHEPTHQSVRTHSVAQRDPGARSQDR